MGYIHDIVSLYHNLKYLFIVLLNVEYIIGCFGRDEFYV